jgi:hypothetical protein
LETPESDPATPESANAQEGNPESLSDPSTPESVNAQGSAEVEPADRSPVQSEAEAADQAAPEAQAEVEEDAVYEEWTVEELRDALSARGLPVSGNKAELIERLQA